GGGACGVSALSQTGRSSDKQRATREVRAYEWIGSLPAPRTPHGLSAILDGLLGAWICETGFDTRADRPVSTNVARQLAKRLNVATDAEAFGELLACDARRVVLAHGILREHELACPKLQIFISGLAGSLESEDPLDPGLFGARYLISMMGLGP